MKKNDTFATVIRIVKTCFKCYPIRMIISLVCVLISAVVTATPSIYTQKVIAIVEENYKNGEWSQIAGNVIKIMLVLAACYVLSIICSILLNLMMAVITQGVLKYLRGEMFNRMQSLPIKFFDQNNHGDIMSRYTNDIDTLRQLISQSIPQIALSAIIVSVVFGIMLYFSIWLALVVLVGVVAMVLVTKKIGGLSAKHFVGQQKKIGKEEGFIEEMMHGQKVVKVFCHEEESKEKFDKINEELFIETEKANSFGNMLAPILNNIGNVLYVIIAFVSACLLVSGLKNVSFSGLAFSVSIVIPFLNMTKQFAGNIDRVSNQVTSVVSGIAGAKRIFEIVDMEPESDDGYVTLVNANVDDNGNITEVNERTGKWAWKHPHQADGSVSYTLLQGDVTLNGVDFEYVEGKPVLHDVTLYAKPARTWLG